MLAGGRADGLFARVFRAQDSFSGLGLLTEPEPPLCVFRLQKASSALANISPWFTQPVRGQEALPVWHVEGKVQHCLTFTGQMVAKELLCVPLGGWALGANAGT